MQDEADVEQEAEPADGGGEEDEVGLARPDMLRHEEVVEDEAYVEEGGSEVEADRGGDERERDGHCGGLEQGRPELQHGPRLDDERGLDQDSGGDAEGGSSGADVVVDAPHRPDVTRHEGVHVEPGGREEEGEEEHADGVEKQGHDVDDGRYPPEPGPGRHAEDDEEHHEAPAGLRPVQDGEGRCVHVDAGDEGWSKGNWRLSIGAQDGETLVEGVKGGCCCIA